MKKDKEDNDKDDDKDDDKEDDDKEDDDKDDDNQESRDVIFLMMEICPVTAKHPIISIQTVRGFFYVWLLRLQHTFFLKQYRDIVNRREITTFVNSLQFFNLFDSIFYLSFTFYIVVRISYIQTKVRFKF